MENHFNKYKPVLFLGLIFIIGGCTLLISLLSPLENYSFLIFPSVLLVISLVLLYIGLRAKRRIFVVAIGLLLFSAWLLFLLVGSKLIPFSNEEIWPAIAILAGLSVIPVALLRYKFLPISFLVSSIVLVLLGLFFLLFSLNVITIPFTEFASKWWPILFIFLGLVLIVLFFYTQKNEKEDWIQGEAEDEDLN